MREVRGPIPGMHVLVAMGSEIARCGLRTMLEDLDAVERTCEAGDLDTAVELLRSHRPDVLVLPVTVEQSAADKLARAADEQDARLLLLLTGPREASLTKAAALDVDGLLLEEGLTRDTLRGALDDLETGFMPMPVSLARHLLLSYLDGDGRHGREGGPPEPPLTAREHQVLVSLSEGLSNKEIGHRLGISEHGVKRHVANLMNKLNCPNRTLLVAVAMKERLVPEPRIRNGG